MQPAQHSAHSTQQYGDLVVQDVEDDMLEVNPSGDQASSQAPAHSHVQNCSHPSAAIVHLEQLQIPHSEVSMISANSYQHVSGHQPPASAHFNWHLIPYSEVRMVSTHCCPSICSSSSCAPFFDRSLKESSSPCRPASAKRQTGLQSLQHFLMLDLERLSCVVSIKDVDYILDRNSYSFLTLLAGVIPSH